QLTTRRMGIKDLQIGSADEIGPMLKKAMDGPVVVGVPVDYRDGRRCLQGTMATPIFLAARRTSRSSVASSTSWRIASSR
ncbi:MAG: hypothetical protein QOE02_4641, partial [Rhodospirillaceae bacterium]|nr:hypothetical protein [Rhodospirillaceae bacterium]